MTGFFVMLLVAIFLNTETSCALLDESKCSKFEYEYKILERIIFLENKDSDVDRKQAILERKNEELVEIVKEQRLVMEEKDKELEQKYKDLELKEKELEPKYKDLELKDEELEQKYKDLELKDKELEQKFKDLELKNTKLKQIQAKAIDELTTKFRTDLHFLKGNRTVAFTTRIVSSQRYTKGQPVVFENIVTNVGGGYDVGTGIFTAPKPGLYLFSLTIFGYRGYVHVRLMRNDEEIVQVLPDGRDGTAIHDSASSTVILNLNIGDKVYVKFGSSATQGSWYLYGYNYPTFSGLLMQ